jgi:hypothetical protein
MENQLTAIKKNCMNSIKDIKVYQEPSDSLANATPSQMAQSDFLSAIPSSWKESLNNELSPTESSNIKLAIAHVSLLNNKYLKEISNFVLKFFECFLTEKSGFDVVRGKVSSEVLHNKLLLFFSILYKLLKKYRKKSSLKLCYKPLWINC